MSDMWGADVERLRSLAGRFSANAALLQSIGETLDALVSQSPWEGGDAQVFASEWWAHRAALMSAADALDSCSKEVEANASAQEATSDDLGGGTGLTGSGSGGSGTAVPAAFPTGPTPSPSPGPPPVPVPPVAPEDITDDGSREGQRRGSRRNQGDSGTGTHYPAYDIDGTEPYPNGIGEGVPGTSAEVPEAPYWDAPADGADLAGPTWNTEDAGFGDHMNEAKFRTIANTASALGMSDASRNMHHYLENSGETLNQNVDDMLGDLSAFESDVTRLEFKTAGSAVEAAKAQGATGPVTFPINTGWQEHYSDKDESMNWYYATGGFNYNLNGQVTVYPPETPGGQWRYEMDAQVITRDRYNWDKGKGVGIGPLGFDDSELQELHRKGLAKEFNMTGESSNRSSEGTLP